MVAFSPSAISTYKLGTAAVKGDIYLGKTSNVSSLSNSEYFRDLI